MNNIKIKEKTSECIGCIPKPCMKGCPLSNNTTDFIKLAKEEKYKEAFELICETSVLGAICGRICPHTKQCQGSCIKRFKSTPVEIGNIEALINDMAIDNNWEIPMLSREKKNKKIAVVGGGPAGLTCSAFLARNGYEVTIFDKHNKLGGIPNHSIPEFRLDKQILENTINRIINLGITVECNKELGKNISLSDLENEFDAVFLSFGKNISSKMNIDGENLEFVYGANELLENKDFPDFKDRKVAVIGGGNVAMDASRTIKQLGARDVTVIYRRSREEIPAEDKEIEDAINENINFMFQTNIVKVEEKNIECIKTELVEVENDNRKRPIDIEGSNFMLDIDYVIMAVGSKIDKTLVDSLGLELNNNGTIKVDESHRTSKEKVFAGGEIADSKQTVAWAARDGRDAADSIIEFLN